MAFYVLNVALELTLSIAVPEVQNIFDSHAIGNGQIVADGFNPWEAQGVPHTILL